MAKKAKKETKNETKPVEKEEVQQVTVETPVKEEPVSTPVQKKKSIVGPIILCAVIVLALVAAIVAKSIISSPKQVFSRAIDKTYKEVSNVLKELDDLYKPNEEAIEFSGTMKVDTNMDLEKEMDIDLDGIDISKLEVSGLFGLDIPNEKVEFNAGIKGSDEKIEGQLYFTDGKAYLKTSFYDKIVKFEGDDVNIDFDDIKDSFKELDDMDISLKLYDELLLSFKKALIKSLDKEAITKEKDEIEVLDKEIKVTRNTYKFNEKNVRKLVKNLATNLLADKDFIKDFAKATNKEKSEVKDLLKEMKESASDISIDEAITVNIYSRGILSKFTGIDIVYDKETIASYYTDGDNIEASINDGEEIVFTAEKNKKEYDVKVTVGGEKVATATVRSYTEEKVDLDYVIYINDEEISGTVYLTAKKSKHSVSGDYKFKIGSKEEDEYIEVSGEYKIETKDELEGFNTDKAISSDDVDEDEFVEALEKAIKDDKELNKIYEAIEKSAEESIKQAEKDKLNFNGMYKVEIEDALSLLKNSKPTVLFVGDTYYYSSSEGYELMDNLIEAQDELDFYSYTVKPIELNDAFKNAIANVEFTCKTTSEEKTTCEEWPAIFLINEGKIVKAYRGTVEYNELLNELKKMGL